MLRRFALLAIVALGPATAIVGCPPTPRTSDFEPSTDDAEGTPPSKAEGSLAALTVTVAGTADKKYRSALERALARADVSVLDPNASPSPSASASASAAPATPGASQGPDLELRLAVSMDISELIEKTDDPDDINTLSHETARYTAKVSVVRAGKVLVDLEVNPDVELRVLTGSGAVVKTVHSREQADLEFSGAAMNLLVSKLLHNDDVRALADSLHGGAAASSAKPSSSASSSSSAP